MFENVNRYFLEHPMPKPGEPGEIRVPTWKFPGGRKVERGLVRKEKAARRAAAVLRRLPKTQAVRRNLAKLETGVHDLGTLRNFTQLYRAYVQTEIIFDDTNTRALNEAIPASKRADRGIDVPAIDWEDYLQNVHFPAITGMTRAYSKRSAAAPASAAPKKRPALSERKDVVAVFDLEGTVVDSTIVHQYLWVRSAGFRKAAWPAEFARLVAAAPGYLRTDRRDRGEFIRAFLRRYEGMPASRLERIVEGGYGDTLLRHTSPDAIAAIKAHREAGHRTVLVTGSIGTLALPLAGLFDEIVASDMHSRDGVLTGFLDRPPLVAEARAAWLQRYAQRNGLDLAESYGYGDSHADLGWLELLGHPHAVNPDTQLLREAQRRHWRVDSWKRSARPPKRDEIAAPAR
jgi:HAD superfamily hydrolase (TIGR01490 family)